MDARRLYQEIESERRHTPDDQLGWPMESSGMSSVALPNSICHERYCSKQRELKRQNSELGGGAGPLAPCHGWSLEPSRGQLGSGLELGWDSLDSNTSRAARPRRTQQCSNSKADDLKSYRSDGMLLAPYTDD